MIFALLVLSATATAGATVLLLLVAGQHHPPHGVYTYIQIQGPKRSNLHLMHTTSDLNQYCECSVLKYLRS
jgi:hypothetical protein